MILIFSRISTTLIIFSSAVLQCRAYFISANFSFVPSEKKSFLSLLYHIIKKYSFTQSSKNNPNAFAASAVLGESKSSLNFWHCPFALFQYVIIRFPSSLLLALTIKFAYK